MAQQKTSRLQKAKEIVTAGEVEHLGEPSSRMYLVGRKYIVNLETNVDGTIIQSCECPDNLYRGAGRCKHILASLLTEGVPAEQLEKENQQIG